MPRNALNNQERGSHVYKSPEKAICMSNLDWSALWLACDKHLKTAQAAATLHDFANAARACTDAQDCLWQLSEWFTLAIVQDRQARLPVDTERG
jgi:hypothetical protein